MSDLPDHPVLQKLMASVGRATAEFDAVADSYHALHADSVRASGEDPSYFARYKHDVLARHFPVLASGPILDFGCGIGNLSERLAETFANVHGFDPSAKSVAVAKRRVPQGTFVTDPTLLEAATYKLVILANVLHHVPAPDRLPVMESVAHLLRPGGHVAIFEHNPINPLTMKAVRECPFDDGVQLLKAGDVRALLRATAFSSIASRYIVFFPRLLAVLRPLEPHLGWLWLGAQHVTFGVRPGR